MPICYALNRNLSEKLWLRKIVKNVEILCPYGKTGLNKPEREGLLVGRGKLAGLGLSEAKQSMMQFFWNEQNQQ